MTTHVEPMPAAMTPPTMSAAETSAVPWYLWAVAVASTSVMVGVTWDISWHRSIGRDSFWTPAHLAIYFGGAVAGLSCGGLVLWTTFMGNAGERARGVTFWGFRGPLGAWVCIWGSLAMITSGPFDDWWHNAYGLDVEILSPPHAVLAAGIIAIQIGAMLLTLARQNTAGSRDRLLPGLFVYAGGVLVLMVVTLVTEHITFPNDQHGPKFAIVSALIFPFLLMGIARAARCRWGACGAAGVYMATTLLMIWILQLFPAQPMLAPILRPLDHMVPPAFPLWLIVPALVVDVAVTRIPPAGGRLRPIALAVAAAVVAMGALGGVQWLFAEFMLTEHARNAFFAADRWDYNIPPGDWQYEFWGRPLTRGDVGVAGLVASGSAILGLWWGNWMVRVRR